MKHCPVCRKEFPAELAFCPADGAPLLGGKGVGQSDPLLGRLLAGRFRIESCIGKGGYGAVYRARQTSIDRDVALKVIRAEHAEKPEIVARFLREAKTASALGHPHIVTVFDFGQAEDGTLFLAMELLEGRSLARLLAEEGPLPLERCTRIMTQICDGLELAHGMGIYHRDLKPENMMLSRVGSAEDFLKILDFGIARIDATTTKITREGTALGTPTYMSPEQGRAEQADQRSDIYSLGVILFEMLGGQPPFVSETALGVLLQHCEKAVPLIRQVQPGADVTPGVQLLVEEMMAKRPGERPSSVKEVRARLQALLARKQLEDPRRDTPSLPRLRTISDPAPAAISIPGSLPPAASWAEPAAADQAETGDADRSPHPDLAARQDGPRAATGARGDFLVDFSRSYSEPPTVLRPRGWRRPAALALGLLALLAVGAGSWWLLTRQVVPATTGAGSDAGTAPVAPAGGVAARSAPPGTVVAAGQPSSLRSPAAAHPASPAGAGARPTHPDAPGPAALAARERTLPATPASQPATAPPQPPLAPKLRIVTRPGGAEVLDGEQRLGLTPYEMASPAQARTLTLRKPRFSSLVLQLEPGARGTVSRTLQPAPAPVPPARRPASSGVPTVRRGDEPDDLDDLKE